MKVDRQEAEMMCKRADIAAAHTPGTIDVQQEFSTAQILAALTMDCATLSQCLHHSRCTCQTCLVGRCTANQAGQVGGLTSALRCHRDMLGPPCDNVSQVALDGSVYDNQYIFVFLSSTYCLRCPSQN
jgi:hypothetical protein